MRLAGALVARAYSEGTANCLTRVKQAPLETRLRGHADGPAKPAIWRAGVVL